MYSHSVLFLLALTILLVNAKTIRQIDDDDNVSQEQRETIQSNHHFNRPQIIQEMLLKLYQDALHDPQEYDRFSPMDKRARAITKGDPREFMG